MFTVAALLSDALTRYGDVLAAMGYNWHISNKSQPPNRPLENDLIGPRYRHRPNSTGNNGPGLESAVPGIVEQVENMPNGDTYRTSLAGTNGWAEFVSDPAIRESDIRILEISDSFETSDPNHQDISERMATMQQAATTISAISPALRSTVDDFHTSLTELRAALKSNLEPAVAVEIKSTRIVLRGSDGSSSISPDEIATTIHNTVSNSRFMQVTDLPFGGQAEMLIQQLTSHVAPLTDIAQLSIELMDDGNGRPPGPINPNPPRVKSREDAEKILDQGATLEKDKKSTIKSKPGGAAQAEADFEKVTEGYEVKTYPNGTKVAQLPDGSDISLRRSTDGRVTISIQQAGTKPTKYRYSE